MLRRSTGLASPVVCLLAAGGSRCGGSGDRRPARRRATRTWWRCSPSGARSSGPSLVDGVPDYTAAAMAAQYRGLARLRRTARRHRHARLARRPAGGLAPRAGGDERPRFRSPGPAAVGQQPGVLRHVLSRRRATSRRARARWRTAPSSCGATGSRCQPRTRPRIDAGRSRHPRAAAAGAEQPRRQRPRPVDVRRRRASASRARDLEQFAARLGDGPTAA